MTKTALISLTSVLVALWLSAWQATPIVYAVAMMTAAWSLLYHSKIGDLSSTADKTFRALTSLDQRFLELQSAEQSQRRTQKASELFVPWRALKALAVSELPDIKFGQSVRREVAILVLDVRGFSRLTEILPLEELTVLLNEFLSNVCPVVDENGGFIQFSGDGFMAVFPESGKGSVEAALAIIARAHHFNQVRQERRLRCIDFGIGVAKGTALITTLGFSAQMQVTVVSDAANTAAKLEKMNKEHKTTLLIDTSLISQALQDKFTLFGHLAIPGKQNKVNVSGILKSNEDFTIKTFGSGPS